MSRAPVLPVKSHRFGRRGESGEKRSGVQRARTVRCSALVPVPGELLRGEHQLTATPTTKYFQLTHCAAGPGSTKFWPQFESVSGPSPSGLQQLKDHEPSVPVSSSTPSSPSTEPDLECSSSRLRAIPHFLRIHTYSHPPCRRVSRSRGHSSAVSGKPAPALRHVRPGPSPSPPFGPFPRPRCAKMKAPPPPPPLLPIPPPQHHHPLLLRPPKPSRRE